VCACILHECSILRFLTMLSVLTTRKIIENSNHVASGSLPGFVARDFQAVHIPASPHRRIAAKALVERLRKVEPDLRDQIALRMGHGVRGMCARLCLQNEFAPSLTESPLFLSQNTRRNQLEHILLRLGILFVFWPTIRSASIMSRI
jgi:hypothetical protein